MGRLFLWLFFTTFCTESINRVSADRDDEVALKYVHNLKNHKLIIDTDIGSDDAVAIMLTLRTLALHPRSGHEILAFTCVHGNTELDNVKLNILKTLRIADEEAIPVYAGADRSLLTTPEGDNYFGKDGLGDFDFPDPPDVSAIRSEHAVNAMIRLVRENPGQITLVAIGPLTNVALAIRLDPTFRKNLRQLMILGGSVSGYGNMPPNLEFNFYIDPEANYIVFNSTQEDVQPIVLLTWDTCTLAEYMTYDWRTNVLGAIKSTYVDFLNKAERLFLFKPTDRWWASDAMLLTTVLDPSVVLNVERYHVQAAVQGELRGGLLPDKARKWNKYKNTIVITDYDTPKFQNMLQKNLI